MQIHDVDIKLLRVFAAVVEQGGFSAAQTALNLSQSSLSEYIKTLETRVGATLCQRGPKGFQLYDAGREVYFAAREMFGAIDTFRDKIVDINDGQIGELLIAVQDGIVTNPSSKIHHALSKFAVRYPGIRITIETMLGFQVLGRVTDGQAALGICIYTGINPQLEFSAIFEEQVRIYCGEGHPLFGSMVEDEELDEDRLNDYRYCNRGHLEESIQGMTPMQLHMGDIGLGGEAQLALILCGRNIGYLAEGMATPYVEQGRLKALNFLNGFRTTPVVVVSGVRTRNYKVARDFVGELEAAHGAS